MPGAVTLVLADHHTLLAEGLGMILDAEDDLVVLDVAQDADRAVESVSKHRPAVLVLDVHLPPGDPARTLAAVKAASPAIKLLVLAGDARPETTAAVIASGAHGVLAKDRSSRQVATAIRKLAAGEPTVTLASGLSRPSRDPIVELRLQTLSRREHEVLGLLAIGLSNRRIAAQLGLSYLTVRSHMANLFMKLGVHSRLEAVAFAVEQGVVAADGLGAWKRSSA